MKIQVNNVTKVYKQGEVEVRALNGLNLGIEEGEFVSVVGDSGSGKTTFLNILGGLLEETEGEVIINGTDITKLKQEERNNFRKAHIAYIFQDYSLVEFLTAYDNVILPLQLADKPVDTEFLQEILAKLKITDRIGAYPNALSGGEKQRVAIARALCMRPDIILADEPTGNLDHNTSEEVFTLLRTLAKEYHQTVVFVTHNPFLAERCDRTITLRDGKKIR